MGRLEARLERLERLAADPPAAGDVRREACARLAEEDLFVLEAFAKRWIATEGVGVELAPEEQRAYARFEDLQRQVRRDRRFRALNPLLEAEIPGLPPEDAPPEPGA